MFHHIVLLRFTPDSTPDQHRAIADALRSLPDRVPQILTYEVHLDAGLDPGTAHLSVHGTFADETEWRTYLTHPEHLAITQGMVAPILETAIRTQYIG